MVKDGSRSLFTRGDTFDIGVSGELVNPTKGHKVQGWQADINGVVDTSTVVNSLTIPFSQSIAA